MHSPLQLTRISVIETEQTVPVSDWPWERERIKDPRSYGMPTATLAHAACPCPEGEESKIYSSMVANKADRME